MMVYLELGIDRLEPDCWGNNMNKEQLQQSIEKIEKELAEMKANLNKADGNVGIPRDYDRYWFVISGGEIHVNHWNRAGDCVDNYRLSTGNVYKTEKNALEARDRRLATMRVLKKLRELEGYYTPKFDDKTRNYSCYYSWYFKGLYIDVWSSKQQLPIEWYSTQEAWEWVISNMESDVKLMLGVQ